MVMSLDSVLIISFTGIFVGIILLLFSNDEEKELARRYGISDFEKIYRANDMIKGESYLVVSGVTNGEICDGVIYDENGYQIESVIFSSKQQEMQKIITMKFNFE